MWRASFGRKAQCVPHCGTADNASKLEGVHNKPNRKQRKASEPGSVRHGLWKCGETKCRGQFTVRKSTIFGDSHLPMHKWLQAFHLISSSKKGISSHQLHRVLEVQYTTAWFLNHRICGAMRSGELHGLVAAEGTLRSVKLSSA